MMVESAARGSLSKERIRSSVALPRGTSDGIRQGVNAQGIVWLIECSISSCRGSVYSLRKTGSHSRGCLEWFLLVSRPAELMVYSFPSTLLHVQNVI